MPLDARVRNALRRAAASVEPDVEGRLSATIGAASGSRSAFPIGLLAAAAILLLVIGASGIAGGGRRVVAPPAQTVVPALPSGVPAAGPTAGATAAPPQGVVGTWTVTLGAGDADASGLGITGTWTMTLRSSGAIDLLAPATFSGSRATGHTYAVNGTSFRTDLYYNDYCDSIGTYAWTRSSDALAFTPTADTCAIRRAVLATRAWSPGVEGSTTP
jgi:hypothetical protein